MRVKNGVEPINHTADTARGGSRPKPPKAVAQRASLEAQRSTPDHETAKSTRQRDEIGTIDLPV